MSWMVQRSRDKIVEPTKDLPGQEKMGSRKAGVLGSRPACPLSRCTCIAAYASLCLCIRPGRAFRDSDIGQDRKSFARLDEGEGAAYSVGGIVSLLLTTVMGVSTP